MTPRADVALHAIFLPLAVGIAGAVERDATPVTKDAANRSQHSF
jgi:hypothetical protein